MVVPLDQRPRSGPYSGINARSAKRFLTEQFKQANIVTAEEDARDLVMAVTGFSLTDFVTRGTEFLTPEQFDLIKNYADRRLSGEPVDHILGWREFFGRKFSISKEVLSPRGDTEVLARKALACIEETSQPRLLDLGTGSGAIIITLLAEKPTASGVGVDISEAALATAHENAGLNNVSERLELHKGEWYAPVTGLFDLIVSNPPYISNTAMMALEPEVLNFDPDIALRGGEEGLDPYYPIIGKAEKYLRPHGWLWVEIGYDQAENVQNLFETHGFSHVSVVKDLSGQNRCVGGQFV